jgi:hypothetical protein
MTLTIRMETLPFGAAGARSSIPAAGSSCILLFRAETSRPRNP